MTTLALVERATEAGGASVETKVVLDAAWTPPASGRGDGAGVGAHAIRPVLQSILDEVDVVETSLQLLDRWADDAGLLEAFTLDGIAWWYQARMLLRWDVHEVVLWRLVLDRLLAATPADAVRVPARRSRLVAAARAGGPGRVVVAGGGAARSSVRRGLRVANLALRGAARFAPTARRRAAVLERRLDALGRNPGGIVALAWPRAYQVVERHDGVVRADPYLAGPLELAAAAGERVITIGLGMDHADDGDWAMLEGSPELLPERFLAERGGSAAIVANAGLRGADPGVGAAIARAARVPAMLGEVDLGPALARLVAPYGGRWISHHRHVQRAAATTLGLLRPRAVFTDREASRTSWLGAAKALGIRSVAVQHGMIYPNSPEYFPNAGARVRPDATCVFGEYERDLLVDDAGYQPDAVIVTGSARPLDERASGDATERAAIRGELGIKDADRLLLVSVAHNELMGELHTFAALERVLGGALPGVHVVIKLHPQDHNPPRHDAFLRDLAAARGYQPPPCTIVRDVDLYRCLRSADAHLGQYSTVLSDAVVAGTPNMIILGAARADTLDYVGSGVATGVRTVDEVRAFMAAPVALDPEARARFLAKHFRAGDAGPRIAAVLLEPAAALA